MKIALIPNLTRNKAREVTLSICKELDKAGISYCFSSQQKDCFPEVPESFFEDPSQYIKNSDMVLSVGGDGSMLRAAKLAADENKNILGREPGM